MKILIKILNTLIFKLKFLYFFLTKKRQHYVGASAVLKELFSLPYALRAKKYIKKIEERDEYQLIYLKNIKKPLYWPKGVPINDLYMVIVELCDKTNGHYYEIPETSVEPCDVVLDCGASEGLFGLIVLDRARKVYLAEPISIFLKSMEMTFRGLNKCEILPLALGSANKSIYFEDNALSSLPSDEGQGFSTLLRKADDLFYEKGIKIDYIKADIEGSELDMLMGAKQTIISSKPKIAITTYHPENDVEEIKKFIMSIVPEYNFRVKGIYGDSGKPAMIHFWTNK